MSEPLIAKPVGKVEIAVGQIGQYVSGDPSQDYHVSQLEGVLGPAELKDLEYNKKMECIHRPRLNFKRDNCLYIEKAYYFADYIYEDSNVVLEFGRRMWEPIPLPHQGDSDYIDVKKFIAPLLGNNYPTGYTGPEWSTQRYDDPQFKEGTDFLPYDNKFLSAQDGELDEVVGRAALKNINTRNLIYSGSFVRSPMWVKQKKTGSFAWAIRQKKANFENQSFTIYCKKAKAKDILKGPEMPGPFDGYAGSYLAVFLGGGFDYLKPSEKEKPYSTEISEPLPGEFPRTWDTPERFIKDLKQEDFNSFAFIFPIGAAPYVIWTKPWAINYDFSNIYDAYFAHVSHKEANNLFQYIIQNQDKPDFYTAFSAKLLTNFLESYIVEKNQDGGWILSDDEKEFSITFTTFNGKIFITSSFAENTWVFPSNNDQLYGRMFQMISNNKNIHPQSQIPSYRISIPNIPIEIHGRGFVCAINMTPTEYKFPINNKDSDELPGWKKPITSENIDQFAHIKFPYTSYSNAQILSTWKSNEKMDGPEVFELPGKSEIDKAFPNYGFDYDPTKKTTTHGLPGDCLSVRILEDFATADMPENIINPYGMQTAITATSQFARYTRFRRYVVVFNSSTGKRIKYASKRYTTPFFFRIKFKGRVISVSPKDSDWIDVTSHVVAINHSATHVDGVLIQKDMSITFMLPKEGDFHKTDFAVPQKELWAQLSRKHFLVRVFLGLDPNNPNVPEKLKYDPITPYFTGVSWGGDMSYSSARDEISIQAKDLTEVLEDIAVYNSPFYDGMDIRYAIATILERAGFSALTGLETGNYSDTSLVNFTINDRAIPLSSDWVLPDSMVYTKPLFSIADGTRCLDAIKSIVSKFWVVFKATREGGFQIDSWPGATPTNTYTNILDVNNGYVSSIRHVPTNLLAPGTTNEFNADQKYYIYRSMPQSNNGGFSSVSSNNNYLYFLVDGRSKKIIRVKPSKWNNIFGITTINRFTGLQEMKRDGILDSIINPSYPNFIGFMRLGWQGQSGYGGRQYMNQVFNKLFEIISKPVMIINMQIWGNRLLEPLDIIRVDSNNFRIQEISGNISGLDSLPEWTMNISGENFSGNFGDGEWITAEDINIYE